MSECVIHGSSVEKSLVVMTGSRMGKFTKSVSSKFQEILKKSRQ